MDGDGRRASAAPVPIRGGRPPRIGGGQAASTVPAPTVRPPSRMAKPSPSSSATALPSLTDTSTVSPGAALSTPSGRTSSPGTSVVRR